MTDPMDTDAPPPRLLQCEDGTTIAYHFTPGKSPGVMFLTGFMSDMTGGKAMRLEDFCRARGQAFLRFDYSGHGASSGRFEDGTIGRWARDAVTALDNLIQGPVVLVGSSMGGWMMILTALQRRERVVGLLGIAPAPDFTEDLIPNELTASQKAVLDRDGVVYVATEYSPEPTPITRALLEDGRHRLLLRQRIPLDVPIRLIHGMKDPDVPWQTSLRINQMVASEDVEITLVKEGRHQLSESADLDRLCATLESLLHHLDTAPCR